MIPFFMISFAPPQESKGGLLWLADRSAGDVPESEAFATSFKGLRARIVQRGDEQWRGELVS